jgi:hypothetical protein
MARCPNGTRKNKKTGNCEKNEKYISKKNKSKKKISMNDEKLMKLLSKKAFDLHVIRDNNAVATKRSDEPYSYWVNDVKMYGFKLDELLEFLIWHFEHYPDSVVYDFIELDINQIWKYFCTKIPGFAERTSKKEFNKALEWKDTEKGHMNRMVKTRKGIRNFDVLYRLVMSVESMRHSGQRPDHLARYIVANKLTKQMQIGKCSGFYYKFAKDHGEFIWSAYK